MFFCKIELRFFSAADTKLMDFIVAYQLTATTHDTGMTQFSAKIIVTQIRVSIKMNDMNVRILVKNSFYCPKRYKMLTTNQKRYFFIVYDLFRFSLNIFKCLFRRTEAKLQITAIKYIRIFKILILIRTICFDTKAFVAYCGRTESRTGAKAGC